MDGMLIGLAMMVAGASGATLTDATAATAVPAVHDAAPRADTRLRLPTTLPVDQPRQSRVAQPGRNAAGGSSLAVKIVAASIGAVGGFYAGGMIGYAAAADRTRDDDGVSGLRGVVIGAPIGAIAGALLGYHVAK